MRPYNYLRYTWYERIDLEELRNMLSEFTVTDRPMPSSKGDMSIYRNEREGIHCKADNLSAFLYQHKAVLYQAITAPFTKRDMRLREMILMIYPQSKSSMLTLAVQSEPEFTVIDT